VHAFANDTTSGIRQAVNHTQRVKFACCDKSPLKRTPKLTAKLFRGGRGREHTTDEQLKRGAFHAPDLRSSMDRKPQRDGQCQVSPRTQAGDHLLDIDKAPCSLLRACMWLQAQRKAVKFSRGSQTLLAESRKDQCLRLARLLYGERVRKAILTAAGRTAHKKGAWRLPRGEAFARESDSRE
jgi:hypothetical protein